MEHTYLRYECADSFGVTISSASSKAPNSSGILDFTPDDTLLTVAGSHVAGFRLQSALQPVQKFGHTQQVAGNMGTGKALNGEEMVCLATWRGSSTASTRAVVATGWVDGTVRVFDTAGPDNVRAASGANSLLDDDAACIWQSDPLLLNGHGGSPVRVVRFDSNGSRLASGGSDGTVVLWDVLAETGLYRLLGHRGGVTDISFVECPGVDALISCSLDCLIKVWDLEHQCCVQTIVSPSAVLSGTCIPVYRTSDDDTDRWRLVAGDSDGNIRVWSVERSANPTPLPSLSEAPTKDDIIVTPTPPAEEANPDDLCRFMGMLKLPPNVVSSSDKAVCVQFDDTGRYVGVLRGKHVDVFMIRSTTESQKKRTRRLRRRQEKSKKKSDGSFNNGHKSKKRGILDDDDEEDHAADDELDVGGPQDTMDPELIKASDEFEYLTTVRTSQKMRGFRFCSKERKELCRIVGALMTNALETHSILRTKQGNQKESVVTTEKVNTFDFYGHPTGIRSIAISSDDRLTCTVSKNAAKIWTVASRSCIQSLSLAFGKTSKKGESCYGLCAAFLPGNTHVVVGTREGHLLLIDISAGDVVYVEEGAHDGAIWALDVRRPSASESSVSVMTGSADKSVKFWSIESQDDDDFQAGQPMLVHTRTLQMTDDVIAVKCSHSTDSTKRLVFVSTLDCTVKVFFEDSLKMFLSLYGHKLPALAVDCSDDDVLLVSGGADKTIKIWGLDFGDTHRTLHGHGDSITDLRFVKRSHYFFSSSKDGSVRYWDADRFEQILLLNGHCAEVNCLAVSRTGAFVFSGGMDRQVRVWERTRDIVFLEEERERELEHIFDRLNNRDEGDTSKILDRKRNAQDVDENVDEAAAAADNEPQSEAAVRKSVLSVSSGDRIMEALERADQESKDIAAFRAANKSDASRPPNQMMLGLEPAPYILWVLRTIKSAEVEQSLIVLSLRHVQRLMYYLIVLLKGGLGIELCSRVAIALVKAHQNQIVATKSTVPPLRELRRLIRVRLAETRDVAGFDLAAMKMIAKVANERKQLYSNDDSQIKDIWAGLGLGSDVAAALEGRPKRR